MKADAAAEDTIRGGDHSFKAAGSERKHEVETDPCGFPRLGKAHASLGKSVMTSADDGLPDGGGHDR